MFKLLDLFLLLQLHWSTGSHALFAFNPLYEQILLGDILEAVKLMNCYVANWLVESI